MAEIVASLVRRLRGPARRQGALTLRYKAYVAGGSNETGDVYLGRRSGAAAFVRAGRRTSEQLGLGFALAVAGAAVMGWMAHDRGWLGPDNPLVAYSLFLRAHLILDLSSWRSWAILLTAPALYRLLPPGWRLVAFPFAANLLFLQISHWAAAIMAAANPFDGAGLIKSVIAQLRML